MSKPTNIYDKLNIFILVFFCCCCCFCDILPKIWNYNNKNVLVALFPFFFVLFSKVVYFERTILSSWAYLNVFINYKFFCFCCCSCNYFVQVNFSRLFSQLYRFHSFFCFVSIYFLFLHENLVWLPILLSYIFNPRRANRRFIVFWQ